MTITAIHVYFAVILAYLLILSPWMARREMAALRRTPAAELPAARRIAYISTMALQWSVTAVLVIGWLLMGRTVTEIGLHAQVEGWQWLAVGASLLLTATTAAHSRRATADTEALVKVRGQLGDLKLLAPHTRAELRRFGWLSITAGICEEILYRGLFMTVLAGMIGLWPAVALSSVIFGIGHAYQGAPGVLRTAAVGLVLALVVVLTGSLPVAMLMHAAIDLVQGRLIYSALNSPMPTGGTPTTTAPQPV